MSALLLDDAFQPATPLTNGMINETLWQFSPLSDILQGSVATHLRCGGIFSDSIIANFLVILTQETFRKSVNRIKLRNTKILCQFLGHHVYHGKETASPYNSRDAVNELHLIFVADAGQIGAHTLTLRTSCCLFSQPRRRVETTVSATVVIPAGRTSVT